MSKKQKTHPYPPYGYPPAWPYPQQNCQCCQQGMPQGYGFPPPPGFHPSHMQPYPDNSQHREAGNAPQAESQHMLDGLMGAQAGMFKELMNKLGIDDSEFWKGAMVGAAATLVLNNETVRSQLLGLLGNAGELLKTGGEKIKQETSNTASSVSSNVSMANNIFHDTLAAGKAGFRESVEKNSPNEKKPDTQDSETDSHE